jgi:RNA-splicing ligase RtcB
MLEIRGKYTSAKIFTDNIEEEALKQIYDIINSKPFENQTVRIMPDVHAGAGITIGFCGTIGDYVCPSHVGVDIGCTVSMTLIDRPIPVEKYAEFNHKILQQIGFGFDPSQTRAYSDRDLYDFLTLECNRAKSAHPELFYNLPDKVTQEWVTKFCKRINIQEKIFYSSINSVGGGNHFVEYDESADGSVFGVTVHCGSRNLGKKVCEYWENVAKETLTKEQRNKITAEFKEHYLETHDNMLNFKTDLNSHISDFTKGKVNGYLNGENMHGYFCDMVIAMAYAKFNHLIIHKTIQKILNGYNIKPIDKIITTHNYIDFTGSVPIVRKGAIRSFSGEKMLVPFNMRDGIAICEGKSNNDWLCSCSHGAGRKMSRMKAKETLSMDEFTNTMEGIYSTTVCKDTIDEAPMAYKDTDEIKELIKDTCEIKKMVVPKINIKATK